MSTPVVQKMTPRQLVRAMLFAQCSVAAAMVVGDTACQYIDRGRRAAPASSPNQTADPPKTDVNTAFITPLIATTPDDSNTDLTLTTPPLSTSPSTALPPSPTASTYLPSSPLPDVRRLSAYVPHWLDPQRSLVMLCTGLFLSGPWSALMFTGTERLFPGKSGRAVLSKVLVNGLTAPVGISLMFGGVKLLEGHSLDVAAAKVRTSGPGTWLLGVTFWPFVSALNFRFVPVVWRPLFGGVAGAAWQTYMAAVAHKPTEAAVTTTEGETAVLSATGQPSVMPLSTGQAGVVEVLAPAVSNSQELQTTALMTAAQR